MVCTISENRLLTGSSEVKGPTICEVEECVGEVNNADTEKANTGDS